jgi:ABC-type branched-subunit amino acid transport system substrate-binding protein
LDQGIQTTRTDRVGGIDRKLGFEAHPGKSGFTAEQQHMSQREDDMSTDKRKATNGSRESTAAVSRRSFVKTALTGAGALAASGRVSFGQSGDVIKVGFITPRTGALAGFGEPDPFVLGLARKALADGISAGDKTYKVEILDRDTQSDPSRAGQLAKSLINSDAVDFMLTSSTPETVNPVADACDAAGVPCLSTGMPWEPWYFGRGAKPGEASPFHWTYHFGFGVPNFSKAYISQWNGAVATNKRVAFLMPNDADGNALRAIFKPILEKAGFSVIDPGGYEDGTPDYAAQITTLRDLHHRADPAGFRGVLASSGPAGLHAHGQDRANREDRSVPVSNRIAWLVGTEAGDGRLLASDLPV